MHFTALPIYHGLNFCLQERFYSNKSGMYSEDSTGYNSDLLTNTSVDLNTSSDTLLFRPFRLPLAHTSPTWATVAKGNGEQVFHRSMSPGTFLSATDDGYVSNGYFSSLDRDSSTTPDQFRMIGLQNTVHDNTTEPFVYMQKSTEYVGKPTGYFLSPQRRDEYIRSSTDIRQMPEKTYGKTQTRRKRLPTDICPSHMKEEWDNTSLSTETWEYFLEEDENLTKRIPVTGYKDPNSQEEAHNEELNMNTEPKTMADRSVSKKQKRFSIPSCFKSCLFCWVEVPDTDQENSIIISDNFRERQDSGPSSGNSTASTDVPGRTARLTSGIRVSSPDRGLRIGYDTDNSNDELEETLV
ncbi:uncharacterized protein LOC117327372 [Pecten maximus]|uniref:uncharacterized protein LOC117327372 n=1 Tax=Pecten maximus TaxID=6579 RepID=UPI0014586B12|nr:uncharacterized protein LOC117327372 [Pecten maximus]